MGKCVVLYSTYPRGGDRSTRAGVRAGLFSLWSVRVVIFEVSDACCGFELVVRGVESRSGILGGWCGGDVGWCCLRGGRLVGFCCTSL